MTPFYLEKPYRDNFPVDSPFLYKNVNPLTDDITKYAQNMQNEHVSGNLDGPEGALEAMYQAVLCRDEVGWQHNTLKLLVLATESWFHSGGSGMGKLSGLIEPADDQCHLENNAYIRGDERDYPTVKQVVDVLEENSIIPIFAVRKGQLHHYQNATEQLFKVGSAEILEEKSKNILDLIEKAYNIITQKQHLVLNTKEFLDAKDVCLGTEAVFTDAQGVLKEFTDGEDVTGLSKNSNVQYTIRQSIHPDTYCSDTCRTTSKWGELKVRTQRYDDFLLINTTIRCNFDCMDEIEANSMKCSGNGDFACGVCLCHDLFFGSVCEFERPPCPTPGQNCTDCINPFKPTEICSGQGQCPKNYCECNQIESGIISGKWCQCSNTDCYNDGADGTRPGICSDHGQCTCDKNDGRGVSTCSCESGWEGDFCECPKSQDTCRASQFSEVCNGRGECSCGKCLCASEDWTGPFCDTRNCGGEPCASCKTFSKCIECKFHSDDSEEKNCDAVCPTSEKSTIKYILVGKSELVPAGDGEMAKYSSEEGQLCSGMTQPREGEPPCKFYYKYYENDAGEIKVWAEEDPHCGIEYSLIIILWAVLAALLIGLLFLCCWRICVFCVDREKRFPTIAYLVEFIKAKYFMKRSQTVAVIPVRRSVFDGNLSIKWRTFGVSVADDDFRLIREGESGTLASTLARGDGNSVEMERLLSKTNWGQGQIEWKDGEEFADIHIDIKGPQFDGREAAFMVELIDRPEEVHFGQKRTKVIVIKDDEPGTVGFAKPSYVFKEADHSALIPVHRSNGIDGRIVVSFKSRDMTAIGGQHYRQTSGEIIFEDGETSKVIEIEFFQDSIFDGREKAFNLELFDPLGGATLDCDRCMVTLLYDETVSVVQFLRQSYPFLENCQKAAVPVIRTRSTKGRSSVHFRTRDITAKAGIDYKTVEGVLEFANGETEKTIEVLIIENDRYIEEGRTFGLELYEPSDGTKMELNNCEIKIIEDDDPGRFEFARSNYVFKAGREGAIIPVMRSMGADGTVKLPWVIKTQDGSALPEEITESGTMVFDNMEIDGAINLNVNVDKEEDTNLIIELQQPTNNARLGHQRSANVKIYGKGHFDEVELFVSNPTILRGAGMSPLIVNLERTIRLDPPQASVVLFETIDGTAKAEYHHYSSVKKAVIFDANETLQQVKIFVDDEIDDETNDDLIFTCRIIPISDSVIVTRDSQEILITNPIEAVRQQNVKGAFRNSAKISFTQEKHLCRLSEETYTLLVKRIGKEDRQASCVIQLEVISGSILPETELVPVEVLFEQNESQKEVTLPLPLMDCEQILIKHSLSDYGPNTSGGNLTETVVNVINDKHVGTVGFGVPEVTFPVADIQQNIHIIRHGGTDGPLELELCSIGDSAVNQVHYEFDDGTKVLFEDGQFQSSVPITFIPGNHGKMVSRKMQLKINSVSGMGKIGQETCNIQLLTDQAPCSISFARPEFSFMAKSGDQGLPLLRIGSLENAAEIQWSFADHTEILEEKGFFTSGTIQFAASKNRSFLKVPAEMLDLLINKSLSVKIEPVNGQAAVNLGKYPDALIKIISGHEPGSFEFRKTRAVCRQNDSLIELSVARQGGADGEVKVDWSSSSDVDKYNGLAGEIVFAEGVHEQLIKLEIDKEMTSDTESFCIQLFKCSDGLIGARNMANVSVLKESEDVEFEFETDYITTEIGAIDVEVVVVVKGELEDLVSLRYATQPDTAQPGEHYLTQSEQLVFKPNESRKVINLNLLDAPLEEPVSLTLSLLVATGPGRIGLKDSCVISIPPAGHPGQVSFTQDFLEVSQSDKIVQLPLARSRGNRGALPVGWSVSSDNWYDRNNGQIMFDDGQSETHIDFPLNCQPSDVPIEEFTIKLHKPVGKAELGPVPSLTVRVHNDLEGGRIGFEDESSEILVHDTDTMTTVLALSDGRNRVQFDLEYQLLPVSVDPSVAAELADAFVSTIPVPAGLQRIPIEIPISYIPSGQPQCLLVKLLKSNNGVRIGDNDSHRLTILSPKRTIGFMETKVNANQSARELILIVKRKISAKERLNVPWIAYTSPEPLSGVLTFEDGQEFDEVRIPFKQMYISGTPISEEFDVELKPGVAYDLEDRRGKCHVMLTNDLGPGVIEFSDDSVRQLQSNGNITVRLVRHERCLEEATVKWRVDAPEGSYFRGLVGTAQFRSGDEGLDLAINVPEMPQDISEENFKITLDQPINASLGDKTECAVSLLNDKTAGEIAFYDPLPKVEQQSNGRLSICVVRTQVSDGDVTQPWRLQPFSSTHTGYKGISGELDFESGETKLWIHLDLPTEPQEFPDESFFIVLDRPKGGARLKNGEQRLEVKIENDIRWPKVGFAEKSLTFKQSDGVHKVNLFRSSEMTAAVVVNWKVEPKSNGQDYKDFHGQLVFNPGESTASIILTSPLVTKGADKAEFDIILDPVTQPVLGELLHCRVVIDNNIKPAKIGFSVQTDEPKQSDKQLKLKLERSGFQFGDATVRWQCETHLGDENFMKEYQASFKDGDFDQEIFIDLPTHPMKEKDAKYIFELLGLDGDAEFGDPNRIEVLVRNDIQWPTVEFSESQMTARQTDGIIRIPVKRDVTANAINVSWRENGERLFAGDWRKDAGTLEFEGGNDLQFIELAVCQKPSAAKSLELELQLLGANEDQDFLLGDNVKCTLNLVQDILFPKASFDLPELSLKQSSERVRIPVARTTNMRDEVSVDWYVKSDNPTFAALKGKVNFGDGQSIGYIEFDLPKIPVGEPFSTFQVCLDRENDICKIGSQPDLTMTVENDIMPSAVEVIELEHMVVRSAGSIPVSLLRKGFSDCPVTISAQILLENQEILTSQISFAPGQLEASFEIPVETIPRYTEVDNYKVIITDVISEHPFDLPKKEAVFQVRNDLPRSRVEVKSKHAETLQSSGHADFTMKRVGNLDGELRANYSIFGGDLDGTKGSVIMKDGEEELDFEVPLPDIPLSGDMGKIVVSMEDVEGFSCPSMECKNVEIDIVHDVKPTKIAVIKPEAAKQSDGPIKMKVVRSGNASDCVTIPYKISSDLPGFRPIEGVVFFDEDDEDEKEVEIAVDMTPSEVLEATYIIEIEKARGGLMTEIEEPNFKIVVSQDVKIPVISFEKIDFACRQSDEHLMVPIKREYSQHGAVMVKCHISSTSGINEEKWERFDDCEELKLIKVDFPKVPLDIDLDEITLTLVAVEGASLPKLGEEVLARAHVESDLKATVLSLPKTSFSCKQSDELLEVKVIRSPPNLTGNVTIGWHVIDADTENPLDPFYERQRGVIKLKDGAEEAFIQFKLVQVPQKFAANIAKIVMEPPVGGRCTEMRQSEALVAIENDIPRPLISLDLTETKVKQTNGDVSLPVTRSRFMGGRILIPWYLDVTNEHSPYYGVGGREMIDDGETSTEIKFKLPNFPIWAESNKLMLRLGGIGGDHHPEGHKTKNAAKVFVNNDIQAEMLSFLVNEIVAKQSDGDITLHVNRSGFLNTPVSSKYHIKSLDPAFAAIKGELAFRAGDVDRTIVIPVSRDPSQEEHVIFTVVLSVPVLENQDDQNSPARRKPKLGKHPVMAVTLINDISRPTTSLPVEKITVRQSEKVFSVAVVRGGEGECIVAWKVANARPNSFYENLTGNAKFAGDSRLFKVEFDLPQIPQDVDEDTFCVELYDPRGENNPMLGAIHAAEVTVINDIKRPTVSFTTEKASLVQSDKKLILPVCRMHAKSEQINVNWKISSKFGNKSPYHNLTGCFSFQPNEELQTLEINISQSPVPDLSEDELTVILAPDAPVQLGEKRQCIVELNYDIKPANFQFEAGVSSPLFFTQSDSFGKLTITRSGNASGAAVLKLLQNCKSNPFYNKIYEIKFLDGELKKKVEVELDEAPGNHKKDEITVALDSINDEEVVIPMTCTFVVDNDLKAVIFDFDKAEFSVLQSEDHVSIPVKRSASVGLASVRWRLTSDTHPFEISDGRLAFDETQEYYILNLPISQNMFDKENFHVEIELYEPKGTHACLGDNSVATIDVKMNLTFFELTSEEFNFKQSDGVGNVTVKRLNNLFKHCRLEYKTSSPLKISEWNTGKPEYVKFDAQSSKAIIEMEFDPTPISVATEKVTLKLLPSSEEHQMVCAQTSAAVNIEYDIEPTKINFADPICVASKRLGKVELPVTCIASNRTPKSKITVSWHSEGLKNEQKGQIVFSGEQSQAVISMDIDMVKVKEYEVFIREVSGAPFVSINNPKCKVKVVDDCPAYKFTSPDVQFKQSEGDIKLKLTSPISAAGREISWKAKTPVPGYKLTGKTKVNADGTCEIVIEVPKNVQRHRNVDFDINIDVLENKGLISQSTKDLSCHVTVDHDVATAQVDFVLPKQTVSRQATRTVEIPVVRSKNVSGDLKVTYSIDEQKPQTLIIPDGISEGIIEIQLDQQTFDEPVTLIKLALIEAGGAGELGKELIHEISVMNDVPLPIFEFKAESFDAKQSSGKISIPIIRCNNIQAEALIGWKMKTQNQKSPLFNLGGLLQFSASDLIKDIEIELSQFPSIVKEEVNEIVIEAVRSSNIGSKSVLPLRVTYDLALPKIDVSVSKAVVQARQTSGSASILVTRSESPIPTAIEVAWIAKPDTPDFPIQTGIIELKETEPSKAINLALPSSPSVLDAIGIDFELVKADIHTADSRQACAIGKSKALIQVDMDIKGVEIKPSQPIVVVNQSQKKAVITYTRSAPGSACQLPWKTVSKNRKYDKQSGIIEFPDGVCSASVSIPLSLDETSDEEETFDFIPFAPIGESIPTLEVPSPTRVNIKNDLMSNQVGFKLSSGKIKAKQSQGSISLPLERTGRVDTVSWVKWKIDGPPQMAGLNSDGIATFQSDQVDGVVLLKLPQKPLSEPYSIVTVSLCEPGATKSECMPCISGTCNTVILQIENDLEPPKIEFLSSKVECKQSEKTVDVMVRRSGYEFCKVQCDWTTDKGDFGTIEIPEQVDHVNICVPLSQEPNLEEPVEMLELTLANPKSQEVTPKLGNNKCFVKVTNDVSPITVELGESEFFFKQSAGFIEIPVRRSINTSSLMSVAWKTSSSSRAYDNLAGFVEFSESSGIASIKIFLEKDPVMSEQSSFDVQITLDDKKIALGRRQARINIANDVKRSIVSMKPSTQAKLEFKQSNKRCFLHVARRETAQERIEVPWHVSSSDHNSPWNTVKGRTIFEKGQYESVIELPMPSEPNPNTPVESIDLLLEDPTGQAIIDNKLRGCHFKVINDIGMGLIEFKRQSYQVELNKDLVEIPLIRSKGTAFGTVVEWYGSPVNPSEALYRPQGGKVMFRPGDKETNIQLAVENDPTGKPIVFNLSLSSVTGRDALGPCVITEVHVGSHLESPGQVLYQSATLVADQQAEVKWQRPNSGGPPSEYVVLYWEEGKENQRNEHVLPSTVNSCCLELEPDKRYNITVIARNSAGNKAPPLPVRIKTLPAITLTYKSDYEFNSSDGRAEITVTRNTTEFQTTLSWRMMRKIIHMPKNESSDLSNSDEPEPLSSGVINFDKGVKSLTLPIKLNADMVTMKEKNALYIGEPGGEILAEITITIVNNTGIPGRVSKISVSDITSREVRINWSRPKVGGPVKEYKVAVRDFRTGREKAKIVSEDEFTTVIGGLSPDSMYKARVIAINGRGKSRYSKFVEFNTLNDIEIVDARDYKMSERVATIKIQRRSTQDGLRLKWQAIAMAEPPQNWGAGELQFAPTQDSVLVQITLFDRSIKAKSVPVKLQIVDKNSLISEVDFKVIDDIYPGCLTFSEGRIEVNLDKSIAKMNVKRLNGRDGKVGCFWNTMEITAKAGIHYVDTKGIVLFDDGEEEKTIEVPLCSNTKLDANDFLEFKVVLIEPQGKCSLGTNQKCYVKLLPAEEKFVFSEKYLTYRLSEKMAIIPVERRFTSGVSTLKWHTRWSRKIHEEDSDDQVSENEGEEPPNWASGFIVFKDGQQKAHIEVPLIDKIPKKRSLCWVYISDAKTSESIARTQMQLIEDRLDAPTNIQTEVHATQCVVMWDFQRYVREYQITYSKTSRQSVKLMKVSGDEENVVLLDLDPCSEYEIMIAAINQFGNSATSETITIMTPGLPPSKPSRLAFQLLSPTSLQVNWGEPTHCHGEITSYVVEYHTIDEHSGIPPMIVPLPGPDHRSLFVENLVENTEYRYTVRAENRWGLGEMRTARMWIKPMAGRGSRPPSTVVMGSESSLASHSTWQGEQGQYNIEIEETDNTTDAGYRSEKHKTWTTHSKGGFTTDTGNSDIDLPSDLGSPVGTFSPDIMQQHSSNQVTIRGGPQQATILSEDLKMSGNKVLRTVVDVNVNPEVKKITTKKVTKQFRSDEGVLSEVEEHYRGQEEYMEHDVQSNIHKDEHVDTDVKTRQLGDTEITTITKTVTHRTVEETRETLTGGVRNLTHHERSPYRVRREKQQPMESSDSE